MNLSPESAELFYRLMWQLQFTVNERLGIWPKANTLEKYSRLSSEDKLKVREALWEHEAKTRRALIRLEKTLQREE
jgi:hypothetical protein